MEIRARVAACAGALLIGVSEGPLAVCSSDPHVGHAAPESPIVRSLLATTISKRVRDVGYVADALELLGQESAASFNDYLERSEWLEALGEPPLTARTVGDAILREAQAEPLAEIRQRALTNVLRLRLATPEDELPNRVDARLRAVSSSVWDRVEAGSHTSGYLRVVLANEGKKDFAGLQFSVVAKQPALEMHCELPFTTETAQLAAGQRRSLFCGAGSSTQILLQDLIDAAQAIEKGGATLALKPTRVLLRDARFTLQFVGSASLRTPWPSTCSDPRAAALVQGSNCLSRGSCFGQLGQIMSEFGVLLGFVFALGAVLGATTRGSSARLGRMWIITGIATIVPILAFGGLVAAGSLGALLMVTLGAYTWIAFAIGLWGSWLFAALFHRRV